MPIENYTKKKMRKAHQSAPLAFSCHKVSYNSNLHLHILALG
jgi:hypothetical protein